MSPDDPPRPDADPPAEPDGAAPRPHAGGFTLDLSSGKPQAPDAWRRQRKKADPLTTKIIDLTQPKAAPSLKPEPAKPEPAKAKPTAKAKRPEKDGGPKPASKPKRPTGATLADLLDPDTLARLRGGG